MHSLANALTQSDSASVKVLLRLHEPSGCSAVGGPTLELAHTESVPAMGFTQPLDEAAVISQPSSSHVLRDSSAVHCIHCWSAASRDGRASPSEKHFLSASAQHLALALRDCISVQTGPAGHGDPVAVPGSAPRMQRSDPRNSAEPMMVFTWPGRQPCCVLVQVILSSKLHPV